MATRKATRRKTSKRRPYRVDYFDVTETQGANALVHSEIVRALSAAEARDKVKNQLFPPEQHFIIRAYRFYKKLPQAETTYVAIDTLFPNAKAAEVVKKVETLRTKLTGDTSQSAQEDREVLAQEDKEMLAHFGERNPDAVPPPPAVKSFTEILDNANLQKGRPQALQADTSGNAFLGAPEGSAGHMSDINWYKWTVVGMVLLVAGIVFYHLTH
jgi:hypothetical protein